MYRCISSFTTNNGKSYSVGNKIYSSEYFQLTSFERAAFVSDDNFGSYVSPTSSDEPTYSSSGLLNALLDSSLDDHSSSSDSFDFGGGESGGAGSGGDF